MIPISSTKLNNKLANQTRKRSLFNEGRFSKRNCICLSIGMVLGLCLAGILFYSSLPNEDYRRNSENLMSIIGIEALKNSTENSTSSVKNLAKKTEQPRLTSTTLSVNTTEDIPEEPNISNDNLPV